MARLHIRTVFALGFAATLLIGGPCLFAAEETAKPDTDAGPSSKSTKSKSADDSGAKKWKHEGASDSKNDAIPHRPLPAIDYKNSAAVAATVDKLILQNLTETGANPAPKTSDEDFLRRVHFDLAGTAPLPNEVTMFGLDPDPEKRMKLIDKLLSGEEYAHNWSAYWRDVIFLRATDMKARAMQGTFEKWMADQFRENHGWDKITTAMLTATGEVMEHGETALIFAHDGQADEIAAEASRIFLGIQIQCANCHDHPSDKWKRQQFHQLAAFFPRVQIKRDGKTKPPTFTVASYEEKAPAMPGRGKGKGKAGAKGKAAAGGFLEHPERLFARFDRNHDGKITRDEVQGTQFEKQFDRLLARADANKDGALTLKEIKEAPAPGGKPRATAEHYMPDLKNPSSKGTKMEPIFFVNGKRPAAGLSDEARRHALAKYITDPKGDPWFSRAYINRVWSEMLGEGFYMPIDDMGPTRQARMPDVLDVLAEGFVQSKYDPKWLFQTIARTEAYQREIRAKDPSVETPPVFAASSPKRLRADQLFNAITKVLGIQGAEPQDGADAAGKGKNRYARGPRAQFDFLFGYDPSTSQDDLTGNVPQALFMMNSRLINGLIRGEGKTRLSHILNQYSDDKDAVREVYVLTLAREPSSKEESICLNYVKDAGGRREGFEDVMWSLMNSSEFLSKR
jgi:Protein of unknown function (DUF1549)/Protein of unknown function (DUF1553)/EF hand